MYQTVDEKMQNHLRQLRIEQTKSDEQVSIAAVHNFFDESEVQDSNANKENDLSPFIQHYQNSFCTFGYSKKEDKNARCFELTVQSRINPEALKNRIFNKFEMYKIH